ncbi:alpha/beta hydrolase [Candidatus Margulisiibacteriota bacterium]
MNWKRIKHRIWFDVHRVWMVWHFFIPVFTGQLFRFPFLRRWWMWRHMRLRKKIYRDDVRGMGNIKESITLETSDEVKIDCRFFPNGDNKKIIIFSHGIADNKNEFVRHFKNLYKEGYAFFTFDYRAHGKSGGHMSTLGVKEQEDLVTVINYVRERFHGFGQKYYLIGHSMGSTIALLVAGTYPKLLHGMVLFSPFDSIHRVFKYISKSFFKRRSRLLLSFFYRLSRKEYREYWRRLNVLVKVTQINIPTLLIHGKRDTLIPFVSSTEIYRKLQCSKSLILVDGAGHRDIINIKEHGVERRLKRFLKKGKTY